MIINLDLVKVRERKRTREEEKKAKTTVVTLVINPHGCCAGMLAVGLPVFVGYITGWGFLPQRITARLEHRTHCMFPHARLWLIGHSTPKPNARKGPPGDALLHTPYPMHTPYAHPWLLHLAQASAYSARSPICRAVKHLWTLPLRRVHISYLTYLGGLWLASSDNGESGRGHP